jgi:hypothetical protein
MGFKLSSATSYPWPVAGQVAGEPFAFTAHFAFLQQDRIDQLTMQTNRRKALLEQGEDDPDLQHVTSVNIAREVLAGWGEDVTDDDDHPRPFTIADRDRLLQVQGMAAIVVEAWNQSLVGGRVGNSAPPRGTGFAAAPQATTRRG